MPDFGQKRGVITAKKVAQRHNETKFSLL